MKITQHFYSEEFSQPARYGQPATLYPDHLIEKALRPLCEALEVLRLELDKPITIISGYRTIEYNRALYEAAGKTPTDSQHSYGRAADIVVFGTPAGLVHISILELYKAKRIFIGGLGLYGGFVHVDVRPNPGHLAQWNGSRSLEETA